MLTRARTCLAAFASGLALVGCSQIQESLECPGDDCPAQLRDVADESGELAGVTEVVRAWRFSNLDRGHSGGVDVRATVGTERGARLLAERIAEVYLDGDLDPVDMVSVVVVPDPEQSERDTSESTRGGVPDDVEEVSCAVERCAAELAAFEDALARDPVGAEVSLAAVGWVAEAGDPHTDVELSIEREALTEEGLAEVRERVLVVAEESGLLEIGDVRTLISHDRGVQFAFDFEGGGDS